MKTTVQPKTSLQGTILEYVIEQLPIDFNQGRQPTLAYFLCPNKAFAFITMSVRHPEFEEMSGRAMLIVWVDGDNICMPHNFIWGNAQHTCRDNIMRGDTYPLNKMLRRRVIAYSLSDPEAVNNVVNAILKIVPDKYRNDLAINLP